MHTCQALVHAVDAAGLGATAPAVAGDYFPTSSADQLATKTNLCAGAKPETHSHFFTSTGSFGSVDQHGNQVDNGGYVIINDHTLSINHGTFHYTIVNGDTLILHPVITKFARSAALADPLEFSTPTWEVAVSYGGQPWKRVSCDSWC